MSSLPEDFDMNKLSDRNYKGQDFKINADLVDQPFNRRSCTDVIMGVLFFCFLSSMGFLTWLGHSKGNPAEFLAPIS